MAINIKGALAEGYSHTEIADYLANKGLFNIDAARTEGYSDSEIVNLLAKKTKSGFVAATKAGFHEALGSAQKAIGETANSETLKNWAAQNAAKSQLEFQPTTSEDVTAAQGVLPTAGTWLTKNITEPLGGIVGAYGAPVAGGLAAAALAPEAVGAAALTGLAGEELATATAARAAANAARSRLVSGAATSALAQPGEMGRNIAAQQEAHPDQPINLVNAALASIPEAALVGFGMPGTKYIERLGPKLIPQAEKLAPRVATGELTRQEAVDQLTGKAGAFLQSMASNTAAGTAMMAGTEELRRAQAGQDLMSLKELGETAETAGLLSPVFAALHPTGRAAATAKIDEAAKVRDAEIKQRLADIQAERQRQSDMAESAKAEAEFNKAMGEQFKAPETPALTLAPEEPLVSFPDGSVGTHTQALEYVKSLPEEERVAARAKLLGYEAEPVEAIAPIEEPKLGLPPARTETMYTFPDGSTGTKAQIESYINKLPEEQQVTARASLLGYKPEPLEIKAPEPTEAPAVSPLTLDKTTLTSLLPTIKSEKAPIMRNWLGETIDTPEKFANFTIDVAKFGEKYKVNEVKFKEIEDAYKQTTTQGTTPESIAAGVGREADRASLPVAGGLGRDITDAGVPARPELGGLDVIGGPLREPAIGTSGEPAALKPIEAPVEKLNPVQQRIIAERQAAEQARAEEKAANLAAAKAEQEAIRVQQEGAAKRAADEAAGLEAQARVDEAAQAATEELPTIDERANEPDVEFAKASRDLTTPEGVIADGINRLTASYKTHGGEEAKYNTKTAHAAISRVEDGITDRLVSLGMKNKDATELLIEHVIPEAKKAHRGTEQARGVGAGQSARSLRAELTKEFGQKNIDSLEKRGLLNIHDTADAVPEVFKDKINESTIGFHSNGQAHLIADRVAKGGARRALLHEIGEHYGLEGMVGKGAYANVLNEVNKLKSIDTVVKAAAAHVEAMYPELKGNEARINREILARVGETAPQHTLWRKLVAAVKNFLVKRGFKTQLTLSDLHDLVQHSLHTAMKRNIESPRRGVESANDQTSTPAFKNWFGDSKVVNKDGTPKIVYHGTDAKDFNTFNKASYFSSSSKEASAFAQTKDLSIKSKELQRYKLSNDVSNAGEYVPYSGILSDHVDPKVGKVYATDNGVFKYLGRDQWEGLAKVDVDYNSPMKNSDFIRIQKVASSEAINTVKEHNDYINETFNRGEGGRTYPVYLSLKNPVYLHPLEANDLGIRLGATPEHIKSVIAKYKKLGYDGIITHSDEATMFPEVRDSLGGIPDHYIVFDSNQVKSAVGNRGTFSPKDARIEFAKKEAPAPRADLDAIYKATGAKEAKPEEKGSTAFQSFKEDPKEFVKQQKSALQQAADKFETMVFSFDAGLNNALRRAMKENGLDQKVINEMMTEVSLAQAVHNEGEAHQFLMDGGIKYNPELHKFETFDDPKGSWKSTIDAIKEAATAQGVPYAEMERYAHKALEARRLALDIIPGNERLLRKLTNQVKEGKITEGQARDAYSEGRKEVHMDKEQIAAGMELFNKIPELNTIVKRWDNVRKNVINFAEETGLYDADKAADLFDTLAYVPFFRVEQLENQAGPKEYSRGLLDLATDKKFKGSHQEVNNIFDNMERWSSYMVRKGINNKSAQSLTNAAMKLLPDEVRKLEPDEKISRGMADNVVSIWENGHKVRYEYKDPLFIHAFKGMESVAIPALEGFAKFTNILRQNIVLNPLFSVGQLSQDSFGAMLTSGLKHPFAIPLEVMKEFGKTLRGTSKTHEALRRVGAVGDRDYSAVATRVNAEIAAGLKAPTNWQKFKRPFEKLSMASDNAVRQAIYNRTLLETGGKKLADGTIQGGDKSLAVERAFEIINFRRGGASKNVAVLRRTVPFFGAYLQSMNVAAKVLSGRGIAPTERAEAHRILASNMAKVLVAGFIYNTMISEDEGYKKLDPSTRDRHLIIPGTDGLMIPLRSDIFTLMAKIIPEHLYQMTLAQETEDGTKAGKAIGDAISNAILSPNVMPQAVKPIIEVAMNHNLFTGQPIVGQGQEHLDTAMQYSPSTSQLAKVIGKTGLISPLNLDYLLKSYFGYTGGLGLMATDAIIAQGMGETIPDKSMRDTIASIPGMSAFVSKEFGNRDMNNFYELKDMTTRAVATLNKIKEVGTPEEYKEYREKNLALIQANTQVNRINENLSNLKKRERQIYADDKLTASEKEDKIHEIKVREHQMVAKIEQLRLKAGL